MQGSVTPLMAAAYQGHDDVIQELLTNEAHVDQQDEVSVRECIYCIGIDWYFCTYLYTHSFLYM